MSVRQLLRRVTMSDTSCGPAQRSPASTGGGQMTTGQILLYCGSCLALTAVGMAFLIHKASVSAAVIAHSETPQTMGRFAPIQMGGLYGTVTVRELVNYYLQNPPPARQGTATQAPPGIGGC
ncbi:MAG TPA: hypothetical protein VMV40_05525 [Acidiferrobacter sp.]|nr:hypothetical protein [Acidiferrobacter sp.]